MKENQKSRLLLIPYIGIVIFWHYRQYIILSELWDMFYLFSVWEVVKENLKILIVIGVISFIVSIAGKYIKKSGATEKILNNEQRTKMEVCYKWISISLWIVVAFYCITGFINIADVSTSNAYVLNMYLISVRPVLLWMTIKSIVSEICEMFSPNIESLDDAQELEKIIQKEYAQCNEQNVNDLNTNVTEKIGEAYEETDVLIEKENIEVLVADDDLSQI